MILKPSHYLLIALSFSLSRALLAQDAAPPLALSLDRVTGEAAVVTVRGKMYVDIDAIVQMLGATQDRQGNRVVVYLPDRAPTDPDTKLSRPLIVAGIELMTIIREWRQGIINATVNSYAFLDQWAAAYQRNADSKLALVSAAAATDGDRSVLELLVNESNLMRQFSDKYREKRRESIGVFPDEIENDPLSTQILGCARGLASMAATHEFQDVPACH